MLAVNYQNLGLEFQWLQILNPHISSCITVSEFEYLIRDIHLKMANMFFFKHN
jgi:hypothetical protein